MDAPVLSLKDIVLSYGSERVLASVSLDVFAGEVLGIRGANGAGKSTLLAIMAGLLKPDSGMRSASPELDGKIALVPQEIALYPSLTGRQNLEFWAEANGLSGAPKKARIGFLLKEMKLTDKAKKRVETYSGGMKRRLNMAAALLVTPKLLLLDEPTAGLDEDSVGIILSFITRIRDAGCAVVLVSHAGEEMKIACDRVLNLKDGELA
ncbi:MAG: ABC transporter ATP-binding protein [Clostridia bacterium]|nr:ABC transporter ATP-binding protein [Clostridia bacterium]